MSNEYHYWIDEYSNRRSGKAIRKWPTIAMVITTACLSGLFAMAVAFFVAGCML